MSHTEMSPALPKNVELANRIVEASRQLVSNGMNRGSCGNISVRCATETGAGNGFLITPSGIDPAKMIAASICLMNMSGENTGNERPSSEWRIHRDIYAARPDVNAVVHTHSTFATTLACLQLEVPPFHYMIAVTGGNTIPCAPYALFGSQELSDVALDALDSRYACLLAHHGMLALGYNLDHAMSVAVEVESLCEQYWRILQAGHPNVLTEEQMKDVHEKFRDYFKK